MFELKSIKFYTGDFMKTLGFDEEIDTDGVKDIVLAFQQGAEFDKKRDVWFMMAYDKNLHPDGGTLVWDSMTSIFNKLNPVDGVEIYGVSSMLHNPGFLESFSIGDLLNTIHFLYDCLDEMSATRRNVSLMNKEFGCKRSDTWKKWFACVISSLVTYTNYRLAQLDAVGERAVVEGKYRFDHLVENEFRCDALGQSVIHTDHSRSSRECEWRVSGQFLEHRDSSCEIDYVLFIRKDGEVFRSRIGEKAVANSGVVKPSKTILGIAVPEEIANAYRLVRQAVYEVVGSERQNGVEYLKVVNDDGEEIWLNREKASSTVTA